MKTQNHNEAGFIQRNISKFIILIFILQPLMDMLSFFVEKIGSGYSITLLLRFGVLAVTALVGFIASKRKKAYIIFALAALFVLAGHVVACMKQEYLQPIDDIANYVRVIQMPLFAMCFISFMRLGDQAYDAIEKGLIINFIIITVSIVLSVITGTYGHTYVDNEIGVLGWFNTSNAQSAIMSMMAPLMTIFAYRKKKYWLIALAVVASFAQLYFLGTRLAFLAMAVTLFGVAFTMLVRKEWDLKVLAIIGVCFVICCGFIKQSPMYRNQTVYNQSMNDKQGDANVMMNMQDGKRSEEEWNRMSNYEKKQILSVIYEFYNTKFLCRRFGIDEVLDAYDYTYSIQEITATRHQKIIYCDLLMKEQNSVWSKMFGMELSRMTYAGNIYDVENDFHGVFYLYGYFGLMFFILFVGYFVFLILKVLIKDFKKYFTWEAAAFGMAFCIALIYAYNTAGVLRRPNSSFYLSVVLAVIYYLTMIRNYDTIEA